MKLFIKHFVNLKIKYKILLSNLFIILLIALLVGISSYSISKKLLINASLESSSALMEQLSINLGYRIKSIEDFIFMQTFNSGLNKYISVDDSKDSSGDNYNKKKSIKNFSYNLISYYKYIKVVIIADEQGNTYYSSNDINPMSQEDINKNLCIQKTTQKWGKTYWHPYKNNIIFANSLIFDKDKLNKIGVISVGIDTSCFEDLYKNITNSNCIVVLNEENNVLFQSDDITKTQDMLSVNDFVNLDSPNQEFIYKGNPYLYTTKIISDDQMRVLNIIDKKEVLEGSVMLLKPILYVSMIGIVCSIFIALFISDAIAKNMKLLLFNIKRLSKGDFSIPIIPESYDEIGMLAMEFNTMSEQIKHLLTTISNEKLQKKNIQLKSLQFEYDALQAKINPHFLYNTLESINSMAKIKGEQEISEAIYLLGCFLRESISSTKNFVPLSHEIQSIKNYLKIQQLSYGDKIAIKYNIDESLLDVIVPKLILQPIVENAIIHGLEPKLGAGIIEIKAVCTGTDMSITVMDDGVGMDFTNALLFQTPVKIDNLPNNNKHSKVGLKTVHKRLQILYGENYGAHIESSPLSGTHVTVTIPIEFEEGISYENT